MKILRYFKFWKLPKKIWIPLILIIISGLYFAFKPETPKEQPEIEKVTRQDIQSVISASGTLTGADAATLKFIQGGKLSYINVKEGDRVKKGQTIAGLDTKALSIQLQQARNTWLAKEATAKLVEDEVKDHASDENFEQKEARVAAQTARDNAFDAIRAAERAFEDAVITSPIAGIVTQSSPLAGQNISGADIVAQVVDDSTIYFDTEIDEADIGQIKTGMIAQISLDAYSDQKFTGTIEKIIPSTKTTTSGATVVIVRININKSDLTFVNGLNGQAEVITKEEKSVLAVIPDAIREDNMVYVKQGDNFQLVKVETGLSSDNAVEIISGLTENQEVVTNPESIIPPSNNPITRFIQDVTS